jgi:RNA polymerase sigma-70 factor (ECF subfamily)
MTSDAEIIQLIRLGDDRAFSALYHRHKEDLFHYCYHILLDTNLATEATQDAFVRAHTALPTLQKPEAVKSWLLTIARNACYGLLRKKKTVALTDDDVWISESPFDQYEQVERQHLVRHYIAQLKPEYREALLLVEYEGLSYAEIADRTASSLSAVESRIYKARRALAKKLAPIVNERFPS